MLSAHLVRVLQGVVSCVSLCVRSCGWLVELWGEGLSGVCEAATFSYLTLVEIAVCIDTFLGRLLYEHISD